MKITTIATKQGHAVPAVAMRPVGPFPPELFRNPTPVTDYVSQPDGGGDVQPEDGTAQNNFRSVKWFRCRACHEAVTEADLETHRCDFEEAYDG